MRSPLWNSNKASDCGAEFAAKPSRRRHRTPGRTGPVAGNPHTAAPPARYQAALDPAAIVEYHGKLAGAGSQAQPPGEGADLFDPAQRRGRGADEYRVALPMAGPFTADDDFRLAPLQVDLAGKLPVRGYGAFAMRDGQPLAARARPQSASPFVGHGPHPDRVASGLCNEDGSPHAVVALQGLGEDMPLAQAHRGHGVPAGVDLPGAVEILSLHEHRAGRVQGVEHVEFVLAAEIGHQRPAFGRREGAIVDHDLGKLAIVTILRLVLISVLPGNSRGRTCCSPRRFPGEPSHDPCPRHRPGRLEPPRTSRRRPSGE